MDKRNIPYSLEAEQSVIGSAFLSKYALQKICDELTRDDFYLDDKKTLAVDDINEIFSMMDESKKFIYDKNYVENLYINYMSKSHKQEKNANVLQENLIGKKVLLIAPGKSLYKEKNKIRDFLFNHDDIITISVNSEYTFGNTDYIFISNIRRFRELNSEKYNKCIITNLIKYKSSFKSLNF